jgi:hypothetical protein
MISADLNLFPSTLDVLHLGLAGLAALSLLAAVLALIALLAALRKNRQAAEPVKSQPAAAPAEPLRPAVPVAQPAPVVQTVVMKEAGPEAALQLLSLLQNEARFIDFIEEDIAGYSDGEIGAAVRVVHEGCRKVLKAHFTLEPIRKEAEGARLQLPKGFDAAAVRLTGNIVGEAPFTGTLVHKGWRAAGVVLPKVAEGHDMNILAQAEVEL